MIKRDPVLNLFMSSKKPMSFRELVSLLGLDRRESRQLKKTLAMLVKSGEVIRTKKGRYGLVQEMSLTKGFFEAHRDGYGFVIPEEPGKGDIFVPPRATLGAMEGDRVIVRIENPRKREGRILRIAERSRTRIVGTIEVIKGSAFLRPKKKGVPFDLYVSPKDWKNAKDGDMVIADIVSYPAGKRPPSARVVKVLKRPSTPAEDTELIIDEYNLPRRFPKEVTGEAKLLPSAITPEMARGRKDLTRLKTVTIDGEKAKDFDDAVSLKVRKFGYTLYVHIADVGFFVPWNSPVDREARRRGTSVYFPDRVIPMLPKKLSEDLCSLKPSVPRLAFTVEMDFTREGERIKERFYPSIIQSDERMTYSQVKRILIDNERKLMKRYDYLLGEFALMSELFSVLRERRLEKGSLDFDLPEPEILLDLRGNPEKIIVSERSLAHMIIEEFMIAANEAVAESILSKNIPSLYRIHEPPDMSKMDDILKVINTVRSRGKKRLTPGDFAKLIEEVRGTSQEDVVNYVILRSLKQARYSPQNVGHFGLASECYTHFTSPIRRYPDLVVHRILREVLLKKQLNKARIKDLEEILPNVSLHSSRMERLADDAERDVVNAMRAWFMKDKVGDEFRGRIVSINSHGMRVRLKDYYVDGFLRVSFMDDDYYIYDDRNIRLVGKRRKLRFSLGDDITVRVDKVDLKEREIIFGPSTP
jgi:ribonuclease R